MKLALGECRKKSDSGRVRSFNLVTIDSHAEKSGIGHGKIPSGVNRSGLFTCEGKLAGTFALVRSTLTFQRTVVDTLKDMSSLLDCVRQVVHVPSETSRNRKWDCFAVNQAPKLADLILRHCKWWDSG